MYAIENNHPPIKGESDYHALSVEEIKELLDAARAATHVHTPECSRTLADIQIRLRQGIVGIKQVQSSKGTVGTRVYILYDAYFAWLSSDEPATIGVAQIFKAMMGE